MTMEMRPITDPAWFDFVSARDDAAIFHHPAWAGLLAECYGYRPFVLVSLDDGGRVTGGIPLIDIRSRLTGHRWISLPFSDVCTPLCETPAVLASLTGHLRALHAEGSIPRVEIRASIPEGPDVYRAGEYALHTLQLQKDPDAVWKNFDRTRVKQPLKQVAKRGVTIRRAAEKKDIFTFYAMFVETRRRHGAPVQPKRFFDLFWDRIIANGLGFLLLAYKEDTPVGGTVFGHFRGTLTAKYNASAPDYWHLRTNNSLTWTAIQWGCEQGLSVFDFGRSDLSNQGLRKYKGGWGSVEEPLVYSVISGRAPKPSSGRLEALVKSVVQKSPPFVCRALGELLYKHYA